MYAITVRPDDLPGPDPRTGRGRAMLTDGIAYGGDYNPEQWDDAVIAEDVALMRDAGVTAVTLGVFAWSALEPEPGRFRTRWLHDLMDTLHEAGIGVDLATATASPPPWLGQEFPSTLPVTADGTVLHWGARQQYNPNSAIYRERVATLVGVMADEFARHPALIAWHVNNEYGCHVFESFDAESADRFRSWLRERYHSLDELNAAWGTSFWSQRLSNWSEVIPPRTAPTMRNPHHLTDWRRFSSDALLGLFQLERDILRRANPAIPITTNLMGLFRPLDYWKWAAHLDFISNDSYPDPANPRAAREFALDCDLMRSLGEGRPFVQMEQTTTAVQWRARNATKRPGQYRLWSVMAVCLGADAIMNFQWRQSIAGAETFHGAMVPHAGHEGRTSAAVRDLGASLAELGDLRGTLVRSDVAIVWDWENSWTYEHTVGPTDDDEPENGLRSWHASLFESGLTVDLVHPGHDLRGYRLVIVPSLFRLTAEHARRLTQAAEAGVHLLVTFLTGYVDERGHAVRGGYLSTVAALLGVRVVDISPRGVHPDVPGLVEPLQPNVDRISSVIGTPAADPRVGLTGADRGETWPGGARNWVETITIDDPDVATVASFDVTDGHGGPAVTVRRSPGRGSAWYVGTDLDPVARRHLLQRVLIEAGVTPAPALPPGVQRLRRGRRTFYLNHSDETVVLSTAGMPAGAAPTIAARDFVVFTDPET